ncbi:MAG: CsgG/HfaB family protein [Planctomycetota bacterium]
MRAGKNLFGLVVIGVILLASCSQTHFITITAEIPPTADIPAYIKNVAVLKFDGQDPHGAEIVARKLEEELVKNKYYTVLASSELQTILGEKAFAETDLVEEDVRSKLKMKAVHAIIKGTVAQFEAKTERGIDIEQRPRQVPTGQRNPVYDKRGRIIRYDTVYTTVYDEIRIPWMERHANVVASFSLIDVNTRQNIDTLQEKGSHSTGKVKGDTMPEPEAECINKAVTSCVSSFVKSISTTIDTFRTDLVNGSGMSNANKLAASGLYKDAESIYRSVFAANPSHWAAAYNLGLVLEAQTRYEEADEAYRKGLAASGGSNDKCIHALQRIEKRKADAARLEKLKAERKG